MKDSFNRYQKEMIGKLINLPIVLIFKTFSWVDCLYQVSFVNGIATIKGGTHVDYVTNQISNYIMSVANKKKKNANIKAHVVKNHLWVFVNAMIDNPAFDSQTKETLTIRQSSFGSKCELKEDFLKKGLLLYFITCFVVNQKIKY